MSAKDCCDFIVRQLATFDRYSELNSGGFSENYCDHQFNANSSCVGERIWNQFHFVGNLIHSVSIEFLSAQTLIHQHARCLANMQNGYCSTNGISLRGKYIMHSIKLLLWQNPSRSFCDSSLLHFIFSFFSSGNWMRFQSFSKKNTIKRVNVSFVRILVVVDVVIELL